jgi:hypothetical protein
VNSRDKSRQIVIVAIVIAGVLAFAAVKSQGRTRDWRDGLPGAPIQLTTEASASTGRVSRAAIEEDQAQLANDLRSSGEDRTRAALRDTNALLAHLQQTSLSGAEVDRELRQTLDLVQRSGCASCSSLLAAALRH